MIIRNKDRESLHAIFSSVNLPFEVWAYGSRVSGEAHDGSDLDIVIRCQNLQKMPIEIFQQLKDKIKYSNIPIVVDLFEWTRLPDSFHKNIEAQHEVFFSNFNSELNEASATYSADHNQSSLNNNVSDDDK